VVQLHVFDAKLHCHDQDQGEGWTISIRDIVLIAEYTTNQGPRFDDYYLEFVTREQNELYYSYVTMFASGIDDALAKLEACLRNKLDLKLASSTDFNSRVVWPAQIAGSPFFRYERVVPDGFWKQLRSRVSGTQIASHIADPIRDYLAAQITVSPDHEPGVTTAN
jgi:hypothetical protein